MSNLKLSALAWRSVAAGAGIGLVLMLSAWLLFQSTSPLHLPDSQTQDSPQPALATQPHVSGLPDAQSAPEVTSQPDRSSLQEESTLPADSIPLLDSLRLLIDSRNQTLAVQHPWVACAVQPDPAIDRAFLLVSDSETTARAFNSYFSFYFNHATPTPAPYPVLVLDRLFQDQNRQQVLASGSYHEVGLAHELTYWLEILVDESHGQALCDFVITCYQKDFSERLDGPTGNQPADWQESLVLAGLEVTYHAGRETYCTFEPA
ncbi:MAG: hypothetical protein PHQ83_04745 [Eubacteriales bacterium]|nr:hypothetical protein [Eubacteriales bacterium]